LVPLVFAGGLGIAHSTQFTEAAMPGRLSCVWTIFPHFDCLATAGRPQQQEASMGEFDFDVVSDVSDAGPRRKPRDQPPPRRPELPPPLAAAAATDDAGQLKTTKT
jgi:hypothetical protein